MINKKLKKLFFITLLFCNYSCFSQINFSKNSYSVDEDVIVYGTDLVIGLENGLISASVSQAVATGTTSINLGHSSLPGMYIVSFKLLDNSTKNYLIGISDGSLQIENSIIELTEIPQLVESQKQVFKQIFNFFHNEPASQSLKPFINGLKEFAIENNVAVVKNLAFCFAAVQTDGTIEMLDIICKDMGEDNLKDLAVSVYKELFKEMAAEGYISNEQYNELQINDYVSLIKMLNKDCSGFFDAMADRVEDENLKIAIKYQGQLCSSTMIIIKEFKKLE